MARAFRSCLTVSTLGSWRGALLTPASKPRPGPLGWASQPALASLAGADWVFLDRAHWTHNVTSEVLGCPQTGSRLAVSSVMGRAGWIPLGSLSPSLLTPLVSPEWPGLRGWLPSWLQVPQVGPRGRAADRAEGRIPGSVKGRKGSGALPCFGWGREVEVGGSVGSNEVGMRTCRFQGA